MALTTTQVNQAFLATLGRPAEGSAATWGSTSLSLDALLDSIFIAENTDGDFVEYLYQNILGRASDAEGKAFWNSLLATTSKEAVLAQFKAAILQAGAADPANADYQLFVANSQNYVKGLYTTLLGRDADEEGLKFWGDALVAGVSQGTLLAQFTAAILADTTSDDYATLTAKLSVADAFSASFYNFDKDVTKDEQKAAWEKAKELISNVQAGDTAADYEEDLANFKGNYQTVASVSFTKDVGETLDGSETSATNFRGTVNLIDPLKGTIQANDTVNGNADFSENSTLTVNLVSDKDHNQLNLNDDLPTSINNVNKLVVNNGSAKVTGNLTGTFKDVKLNGAGDTNLTVSGEVTSLSVGTASKGESLVSVLDQAILSSYKGGDGADSLNVASGAVIGSVELNGGNDELILASGASVSGSADKISINLGAGNDTLTIENGVTFAAGKVEIDGGAGTDTLSLANGADISGVAKISNINKVSVDTEATISAKAISGLATTLTAASATDILIVTADGKTSIDLSKLKVDTGTSPAAAPVISIDNATSETITLNKKFDETISLAATAENARINGLDKGADRIAVEGAAGYTNIITKDVADLKGLDFSKTGSALKAIQNELAGAPTTANTVFIINANNNKVSYVWQVTETTPSTQNIKLIATINNGFTDDEVNTVFTPALTNTLAYSDTAQTLNLTAEPKKYADQDFSIGEAINVTGVSGAFTISGDGVAATVNVFSTDSEGAKVAKTANNATVNVTLDGQTFTLTDTNHGGKLATVDTIKAINGSTITADQALLAKLTSTKAIDATGAGVAANFEISGEVSGDYTLSTGLKVDAGDTIQATLKADTATATITFSDATDTVDISTTRTAAQTITATDFAANDNFKVAGAKLATKNATELDTTSPISGVSHAKVDNGVLTLMKDGSTNAEVQNVTLANALKVIDDKSEAGKTGQASFLTANQWVKFTDSTGTYLLFNGATTASTDNVAIKLTGTVTDFAIDNSLLSVTFA